jgi:peptidoglycan/xylan/chitin deacetylase (PgdA/CDA1 family)
MMSIGMHMRFIGNPSRAAGLERVLEHVMKHKDVWVTRRIDIAKHWRKVHPYRENA